jgi:predicted GIY-YIG superfamily endonuclease
MNNWYVYIVEKKGKLYVGITTDLPNRVHRHGMAKPLYQEGPLAKSEALKRERTLKSWRKEKKIALIDEAASQQK